MKNIPHIKGHKLTSRRMRDEAAVLRTRFTRGECICGWVYNDQNREEVRAAYRAHISDLK